MWKSVWYLLDPHRWFGVREGYELDRKMVKLIAEHKPSCSVHGAWEVIDPHTFHVCGCDEMKWVIDLL